MDWLANFLNKIMDMIISFIIFIWDLILSLLSWLYDFVKWVFFELFNWVLDTFLNMIESCFELLGISTSYEWTGTFYAQINYFFPLNELFGSLLFLFGLWITCLSVKVILKLCPTVY